MTQRATHIERRQRAPFYGTDYFIRCESSGYVMRGRGDQELVLCDMCQESFEVRSVAGEHMGVRTGMIIMLAFTERGVPYFIDEQSNPIEVASLVDTVMLRCVTPADK